MIINVDTDAQATYFFTAGNLPTQKAYSLTPGNVLDTFIVGLLRSDRLLCAASYFFETPATRALVERFPRLWRDHSGRAVFFVNEDYASFSEHGLGKLSKSPAIFSPYADGEIVKARGKQLDDIGVLGRRRDVDISSSIAGAWISSCVSPHQDSICTMLRKHFPERFEAVAAACADLANRTKFDFIWETIEAPIRLHPDLSRVEGQLRRRLADIYATVMSQTLGAIETSPSLRPDSRSVTSHSTGHLGLFWDVLRRAGLVLDPLRDESTLLKVLDLDELAVLRQMDEMIIDAATNANAEASDYWQAVRIAEGRVGSAEVTHLQMRVVLRDVMTGLGLDPADGLLSRLGRLETVFIGRVLPAFRQRLEQLYAGMSLPTTSVQPGTAPLRLAPLLLICSADAPGVALHDLALSEEYRDIRNAVHATRDIARIWLDYLPNLRASELSSELRLRAPKYLHFSGHGTETGHMSTLDESGERHQALHSSVLAEAIRLNCPDIECVYLNACFSEAAITDIGDVSPYSVVVGGKVSDRLARSFATAFYGAVAAGRDIVGAFESAVSQVLTMQLDPAPVRLFRGKMLVLSGEGKAAAADIGKVITFGKDPYR